MPVHGHKVDSKCFGMSRKVDAFLGLGNVGKSPYLPADFWGDLSQSKEAVSSYIVCLIAKLIALDSEHGLKPLPEVYRDLVEMPVDYSKYKHWSSKSLPSSAKSAALELQHSIVNTIYFLKEVYGYIPSIHLRHMYLRWNLARNYSVDGRKAADVFEEKAISSFSVAQSKQLLHNSPQSPVTYLPEQQDERSLVISLVKETYQNHRRTSFGVLPPIHCQLCSSAIAAMDSLSYTRLRDLVSRSPALLKVAMDQVLSILKNEVSHSQDCGDRELLLPLLHLFKEFLTMMAQINTLDSYQSLLPFYMWPVAHADSTRRSLDMLMQEGKVRGTAFRRKLLTEHDLGLNLRNKIRGQLVAMLVDTSHPLSRGSVFLDTFQSCQEDTDQGQLQRLLLRNIFRSVFPTFDVVELEGKLLHLSVDTLRAFCTEATETVEKAASMESNEESQSFLTSELNLLHGRILHDSEEQRDSAVSCSSIDNELYFTEENLATFSLPSPNIPAHSLDNCQYPTVLTRLREILVRSQNVLSPKSPDTPPTPLIIDGRVTGNSEGNMTGPPRPPRTLSDGSWDSAGSTTMEPEIAQVTRESLPNGHIPVADGDTGITESHDAHVISPDSGHASSPEALSPEGNMVNGLGAQHGSRKTSEAESESSEEEGSNLQAPEISVVTDDTVPQPSDDISDGVSVSPSATDEGDALSQDSGSRASGDSSSRTSGDSSSRTSQERGRMSVTLPREGPDGRYLTRRATAPSFGLRMCPNTPPTTSVRRNYHNVAGKPSVQSLAPLNPMGSLRVKTRANPFSLSIRVRKRTGSKSEVASPVHNPNPRLKVLKIVLAGNDLLVSHMARAYAYLQSEEPNLFGGLDLRFFHVPISRASSSYYQDPSSFAQQSYSDLQEPMLEQVNGSGNDVHIGRFLAHMDSWYERNVMLTVHSTLRLLPTDLPSTAQERPLSSVLGEGESLQTRPGPTPSKILIDSVASYCREANHCIRMKMFRIKMALKAEKSHKIEHREMYMLHRLDIQRLSNKKGRQAKTFEANITMTELSLDNSLFRSDMMQLKDMWLVRACNIPKAGDYGVPNPEAECLELTIVKAQADGGMLSSSKYRSVQETQHHVYDLVLETREKPLTVMVDGDTDVLIENVIRLEVCPAYLDQSFAQPLAAQTRRNDHRLERQLHFPLMTYWPIDL